MQAKPKTEINFWYSVGSNLIIILQLLLGWLGWQGSATFALVRREEKRNPKSKRLKTGVSIRLEFEIRLVFENIFTLAVQIVPIQIVPIQIVPI